MDTNVINKEETLALCNENESLAKELMMILKTDLPRQKMILLDAYAHQDRKMMRDIVHQILGTCSYISLPDTKQHALSFHAALHDNIKDLESYKTNLVAAMDAVIVSLPNGMA